MDDQPEDGSRDDGYRIIFRPWRKLPDGTILWARKYGLRAWPIRVPVESTS